MTQLAHHTSIAQTWTCKSCGWVNGPDFYTGHTSPKRCKNCRTYRGEVKNVVIIQEDLPKRKELAEKGRTNAVQTWGDGTPWIVAEG
jgi:hypothetical protein